MKKITLLLFTVFAFTFTAQVNAQCTTGGVYQGAALINDGTPETQSTCNFFGEYNNTTNVIDGNDYIFSTDSGYVTVTHSDGITVVGHGPSPLTLNGVTTSGDGALRVYWHLDAACGTDSNCHTTTVQCISASCTPPPPPANDDCANAIMLACDDVVAYSTTIATLDDAIPCGTDSVSANVWYTYQGTGTPETITLSTCSDADYDTKLFVYSGACGSLVCVANNDDFTGCTGFTSQLEFISDGTTEYKIAVTGYHNPNTLATSEGNGNLTITCAPAATPPANNICDDAEALTFGVTVTGDNTNATAAVANPTCDAFGVIADVWYSFQASATLAVDITSTVNGTATNAKFAVYDACGGTELGCSTGGLLHIEPLIEGNTYLIQVWNDGAAAKRTEGTFDILVTESALSTQDLDADLAFTYYPNPVTNALTLKAQKDIENVSIYNMLGQEVLSATPNTINADVNMTALQSGAYFVKVTIGNATQTVRVIKN